jgi:Rad3-related DNA helicase
MSVASAKSNLSTLTEYIEDALEHKEGKGLIHATYGISAMLKATHLGSHPRLIFHTNKDKKGRFKQWQNTEDGVLVGCGMTEGINLKNDMGRWQLITKVLWPHLGHPVVIAKRWGENGENWYNWQAAKDVIQSYGRICRWPKDFGETRIVDSSFINLYNRHRGLFPNWFKEAVL